MRSTGSGISGWDETRMISSLRAANPRAIAVFSAHFTPRLLERAARSGFSAEESRELVTNFLTDWLLSFVGGELKPKSLHAYVCGSFSHFIAHEAARKTREMETQSAFVVVAEPDGVRVVAASCSAHSLQSSRATEENRSLDESHALRLFAGLIASVLNDEERLLLRGVVEEIPRREIAVMLNVSYSNAGVMLSRLRLRLRAEALAIAAKMPLPERAVVERFLKRIERAEVKPALPETARHPNPHLNGGQSANG
jgi:DNA-directed RNA polymerase specialized sigma24 family protein